MSNLANLATQITKLSSSLANDNLTDDEKEVIECELADLQDEMDGIDEDTYHDNSGRGFN